MLVVVLIAWELVRRRLRRSTLLTAAALIDGTGAVHRPGALLVDGDRVVGVGERDAGASGAQVVHFEGATILPGLIDNHTHVLLQGDITAAELHSAASAALPSPDSVHLPGTQGPAQYFVNYVKQQLVDRCGSSQVFGGGLKVTTTIDLGLQQLAQQAISKWLTHPGGPSAAGGARSPRLRGPRGCGPRARPPRAAGGRAPPGGRRWRTPDPGCGSCADDRTEVRAGGKQGGPVRAFSAVSGWSASTPR